MNKWKHMRLGDVISTNIASYSNKEGWSYVNYLDTGNITENSIANIQLIDLNAEKLPSRAKRKVKYNSIVYSTVRPNQRHFGIIKKLPENFLVSTGFVVIDVCQEKIDADFLYFWLSQENIVELLHTIAEQSVSTYPSIKASDIGNLEIDLPPIEEQKKIASVLLRLMEKMELNMTINDNLSSKFSLCLTQLMLNQVIPSAWYQMWLISTPNSAFKNQVARCIICHNSQPLVHSLRMGYEPSTGECVLNGDTLLARITPSLKWETAYISIKKSGLCSTEYIVLHQEGVLQNILLLARYPALLTIR